MANLQMTVFCYGKQVGNVENMTLGAFFTMVNLGEIIVCLHHKTWILLQT